MNHKHKFKKLKISNKLKVPQMIKKLFNQMINNQKKKLKKN